MKKLTSLILFALCLYLFIACDSDSDSLENGGPTSCRPVCMYDSTKSEGWYYDCDSNGTHEGDRLLRIECTDVSALCKRIGTRSEGWYTSDTDQDIDQTKCSD